MFTHYARPHTEILTLPEQEESDPALVESVRAHIEDVSAEMQRLNPSFIVTFAGGVSRRATVNTDDPLQYVSESVLWPDGSARIDGEAYVLFNKRARALTTSS